MSRALLKDQTFNCTSRLRAAIVSLAMFSLAVAGPTSQVLAGGPAGDDCATPIEVFSGVTYNGSNVGATGTNDSDCAGTADTTDIWHSWLADCNGNVTVSLCGSSFDTSLSVFTNNCPPLLNIACNDDFCGAQSQLTFQAFAGTTYLIRVAGFNNATGNYTLNITCPPMGACCQGNGVCTLGAPGDCEFGLYLGDGTTCEVEGLACAIGSCCTAQGCTETDQFDCEFNIGGIYLGDGTNCLDNTCPAFGACCIGGGACNELTEDVCVNNFLGTYLGDGSVCDNGGINPCTTGACCLAASCIEGVDFTECSNQGGNYIGDGTLCSGSVCNDDCFNAIEVFSGVTYNGTTVGSTGTDESSCAGIADVNDVWHSWLADCTGDVVFSLCGSSFDTTLTIFDGCPPATELACNDDNAAACGPGNHSQLTLNVTTGITYVIRVSGWNNATGTYALNITCPPEGACCTGSGQCSIETQGSCSLAGGLYLGDDTTCEVEGLGCATGACCTLDGMCNDSGDEAACDTANGIYAGDGSTCATTVCPAVGACCTNGVCTVTFQPDCTAGGGSFVGDGTICDANTCMGACCTNETCTIVNQDQCTGPGDLFWGPGSSCDDVLCPGPGFILLNYNWNGIAHVEEFNDPDRPDGYRSIGDRGLRLDTATSIGGGFSSVQSGNILYSFETRPDVVDTVMIGRRSVNPSPWDDVAGDTDNIGIAPNWDPSAGTGIVASSMTTLTSPLTVGTDFELGVLSHGTEGGGMFNMTLTFTDATVVTVTLDCPDWFANGANPNPDPPGLGVATQVLLTPAPLSGGDGFDATASHDRADPGAPLSITQATVTHASILAGLGIDVNGKSLESITFDNWVGSTFSAGGIYAVSVAVPGACCQPNGSCTDGMRTDCENFGGIYQGDGTECAVVGAGCAIGACCFNDGSCVDDYQANQCITEGGVYLGAGTMCATSSCPETGACCDSISFSCAIDFESTCTGNGGVYFGDGTDCSNGCDCNSSGTLDIFELSPATDCDDDAILDECETPDPSTVGACCLDGECTLETSVDCDTLGGIYFGDCTTCGAITCPGEGYVALDFNWNGIVHPGESNMPDNLDGYRSISDRGLIYGASNSLGGTTGTLTRGNLTYYLSMLPARTDIVRVGRRGNAWDPAPDGDNVGIQPNWDPSDATNTVVSANSMFNASPVLDSSFELGVLYHAHNGGGNCRMTLGFTDATSVSVVINAPDWFANNNGSPGAPQAGVATQVKLPGPLSAGDGFLGAAGNDNGTTDSPLNCIEATVTASSLLSGQGFSVDGKQLNSITFDNWVQTNSANSGIAVFAATYFAPSTACGCLGDVSGDNQIDGDDIQGFTSCVLGGGGDCSCADIDGGGVGLSDVSAFVNNLLTIAPACP